MTSQQNQYMEQHQVWFVIWDKLCKHHQSQHVKRTMVQRNRFKCSYLCATKDPKWMKRKSYHQLLCKQNHTLFLQAPCPVHPRISLIHCRLYEADFIPASSAPM
ncbi:uncharacterized protein LOC119167541 isoform X4 [Rhipicephalus microplus]